MSRRNQPTENDVHRCGFDWCTGTAWVNNHYASWVTDTTGRDSDVVDERAANVLVVFDETEDCQPRILLHVGGEPDADVDVSPTASQARRIAMNLLTAAEALDDWHGRNR